MDKIAGAFLRWKEHGAHYGAQLYISKNGSVIREEAFGEAAPGNPTRTDSIIQWYSSGKPLTAVAIAQLYESGSVQLHERVSHYIPEFAVGGKEQITLRHLLTHTAGLRLADRIYPDMSWPEIIAHICETTLEPNWTPGEKAGYSAQAAWFILAEIIQRVSRMKFTDYLQRKIFTPLSMKDTWLQLPPGKYAEYGDRIAPMYDTEKGKFQPDILQDEQGMAVCRPGSSARGPVKELGRFYEALLAKDTQILREETIQLFTSRHRTGLFDYTFLARLDWGLGFLLNSKEYNPDKIPYAYGRYASAETFGHSGAQSSCAFADPKHGLVVAWVCNGMPGERQHQERQREINNGIYEELGLTP
jgi:CubicO group peptidase (beta-lactamase class C family)